MTARKAIRAVAKSRGISEQEVRDEIRYAITVAWANSTGEAAKKQQKVPCKGEQPTPEELIEYLVKKIRQ